MTLGLRDALPYDPIVDGPIAEVRVASRSAKPVMDLIKARGLAAASRRYSIVYGLKGEAGHALLVAYNPAKPREIIGWMAFLRMVIVQRADSDEPNEVTYDVDADNIYVLPEWRGKKVALALSAAMIDMVALDLDEMDRAADRGTFVSLSLHGEAVSAGGAAVGRHLVRGLGAMLAMKQDSVGMLYLRPLDHRISRPGS